MQYIRPYRIEHGAIFKYSKQNDAYVFYAHKIALSPKEYAQIKKENAIFEKNYDLHVKQNKGE